MKQFIVLMAMVVLGLFIYACVSGPGDSILAALKNLWRFEIASGPYTTGAAFSAIAGGCVPPGQHPFPAGVAIQCQAPPSMFSEGEGA